VAAFSSRLPWNIPQSTRTRSPHASTKWQDPVTVLVAPWREIRIPAWGLDAVTSVRFLHGFAA
jgi:hypothetical protein